MKFSKPLYFPLQSGNHRLGIGVIVDLREWCLRPLRLLEGIVGETGDRLLEMGNSQGREEKTRKKKREGKIRRTKRGNVVGPRGRDPLGGGPGHLKGRKEEKRW